ncbi:MAG: cytidylate kinase-like family protein [Balneolaceae bacterium]|nr:cytidylate kinase-like family protein [Balneolaceae bacterium]
MAKRVSQMIEEQVHFWRLNNSADRTPRPKGTVFPVITISRAYGAKGAKIAQMLEAKIGFKVWDKEILNVISEELGSSVEFLESLDEHAQNLVDDTIFGILNQKSTNLNYLLYLVRAVQTIEKFGNAIIVGRGANHIVQNQLALNVRTVAPISHRIQSLSESRQISKEEARAILLTTDEDRAEFTRVNFNKDINDASNYDLTINIATYSQEDAVAIICDAYEKKTGISITELMQT